MRRRESDLDIVKSKVLFLLLAVRRTLLKYKFAQFIEFLCTNG